MNISIFALFQAISGFKDPSHGSGSDGRDLQTGKASKARCHYFIPGNFRL